ncbi:MAG: cbb3-type cytochrome c oxidase subunit I [Gammaproteobacteria bacterium]|nr:cbb3-type cytochrome c oxidase subunit I [Gammaproteobacteria bacterium]MCW8987905.1 cbb3-type cytochrome c oxidase subunit I [Gammaproteobacteria bacterium]
MNEFKNSISTLLLSKKYWFIHFWIVSLISIAGLVYMGGATYMGAPPVPDFKASSGELIISSEDIMKGQELFHLRGLMNYGSFWGDGAERGPDFSAESLHAMTVAMKAFYAEQLKPGSVTQNDRLNQWQFDISDYDQRAIESQIKTDLHKNTYTEENNVTIIDDAQIYAIEYLNYYYTRMFTDETFSEAFHPVNYITNPQHLKQLTAFFYWGSWVASADRPGNNYSYTSNWPYDPAAGNTPPTSLMMWSFVSIFVLLVGIMIVLYVYGQMKAMPGSPFTMASGNQLLTTSDLEKGFVRPTQRATYKFFALAIVLFGVQVLAGILAAMDFASPFAHKIAGVLPFNILRSYHTMLQIFWFFMCWVGYTIFFLPRLAEVPRYQEFLINLLFVICAVVGIGGVFGIYFGQSGILTGTAAYWFGSQGWEFMELGRFFQMLLLAGFALWIFIIYRGIKPWITKKTFWSIPAWLLWGSGIMVFFLFFGLFATIDSNWAIADYWRWMVVHMWVEVTFEVFTTVIVGYILVQMGLVTRSMAEKTIYLAVMLFLITATIGVAHNFYWIAKPTSVIALGSVFSTLQILPLLLLTLDAWQMRKEGKGAYIHQQNGHQNFIMDGVWLFILAVNFWNIFGAGVLGSLINLPIVNYFEHATYLTGNHAHAAMFGVKGNIALAGVLFCCQHLFNTESWNPKIIKLSFWSLNIGVALMMFLDLFPVGLYQLSIVLDNGFWLARAQQTVAGEVFQTLTYFRSVGGLVFVVGVLSLIWFILSRGFKLKPELDTHSTLNESDSEYRFR